ncbi:MAG: hypothetical protein WAU77_13335 [Solirubrobacteraceae bacterium]
MSAGSTYNVAIWTGSMGQGKPEDVWGLVLWVEPNRWCQVEWTPRCPSDDQVIREARDAAEINAKREMPDEKYRWHHEPLTSVGPFVFGKDRPLVSPRRIEDLEVSR